MSKESKTHSSEKQFDAAFSDAATASKQGFNITDCLGMMGYPYNTKDAGGFKLG